MLALTRQLLQDLDAPAAEWTKSCTVQDLGSPRRRGERQRRARARSRELVTAANAINTTLYEKLIISFNFIRDIAPVAGIMRVPSVMVVNPSVPAKTIPGPSGVRGDPRL
jgi:hypothetical protein